MPTPHLSRGVTSRRARVERRRLFMEGLEDRRLMALIAEDSFETYTAGEQVEVDATTQLNGGTGWTTAYQVLDARRTNVTVASAALNYSGGAVTVNGGTKAMRYSAEAATEILAGRSFASQTGTPIYFSFLYQVATNPDPTSDFIQVGLANGNANEPLMSVLDNSATFRVRLGTSGTGTTIDSMSPVSVGTTYFMVGKVDKGGTNYDKVTLYVNPTTITEPGVPTVTTTLTTGASLASVNSLTIRKAFLETGDVFLFDEFRVGTSFADVLPPPPAPTTLSASLVGGALTIADIDGVGKDNNLTIARSGSNLVISDTNEGFTAAPAGGSLSNGGRTLILPIASVTAGLTVNGAGGNDLVTLNLAGANPFPTGGIAVNGGNPTTGPGDRVSIVGGSQGDVTYNYTNASDGNVIMSALGTLTYTGLEPLTNTGTATNVVFNLPGTADAGVTLSNLGGGQARLAGTTFEQTDFAYPVAGGSITINLGANDQTLSVNSLTLNPNTDLIIDGQGGNDSVNVSGGGAAHTITDQLSVTAETINQTQGVVVTGATLLNAGASGAVTLTNTANNFSTVTVTNAGTASLLDNTTGFVIGGAATTTSLTVSSDDTITQTGLITAGDVIKQGTGSLDLSQANTYAGVTTVSVGEILVSNAGGLGTAAGATTVTGAGAWVRLAAGVTIAGETINLAGAGDAPSTGALQGDGAGTSAWNGTINLDANARVGARTGGTLSLGGAIQDGAGNSLFVSGQSGTGVVVLTGATKTYTGATNIVRGILRMGAVNVLPATAELDVDNTTAAENALFDLNGFSQSIGNLDRGDTGGAGTSSITNSSATAAVLTVNQTVADTYNGTITGNLALTKAGAAQLTLGGSAGNTYTGLTTVSAGRLHLDKSAGNAIPGDLSITTGGQVTYDADNDNQIGDTAAVTVSGATSAFNGTAPNTTTESVIETIGSLTVTGGSFSAGTSTWTITGAMSFTGGANTIFVGNSGSVLSVGSLSLTAMTATAGGTVATNNSFTLYGNNTTIQSTLTVGGGGLSLNGSVLNLRRGGAGAQGSRLVLNGDISTTGGAASSIIEDTAGGTTGTIEIELSGAAPAVNRTFTTAAGANLSVGVPLNNGASAAASVVKEGPATLTLQRVNTYTGDTIVNAGALALAVASVNSIATSPNITLASGAGLTVTGLTGSKIDLASGQTLRGEGTVTGGVNALSGAIVSPAVAGTGILNTGNAAFNAGADFNVEINGLTAGTQYDQLNVTGTVSLGNGTLNLSGTLVPNPGVPQTIVLINNDGTDAVTGTFNGLPESAPISFNGGTLYISYVGGTGNDVTLVSQPPVNGTAAGDTLVVTPTATGYDYQLNGGAVVSSPLILPLVFNGLGGDDLLIVNVNNNPIPQITYNGGAHDTPLTTGVNALHGDVLQVVDQTGTHTATYLADGAVNASLDNDGTVTIAGQNTIAFNGLEPVDLIGFLNANVTLPNANDVVTITTGTDSATNTLPALIVSGTSGGVTFEAVHLRNNTNVLIDTTTVNGNDTVTVNAGAGTTHGNVNFSIVTGTGTDTVAVTGGLQVTGAINVSTVAMTDDSTNTTVLAAATISLTTTGAIGATGNPDIDVTTPNLTTSSTGNQFLRSTVALPDLNLNAGAANITLTMAAGSITDTAADGNDVVANTITFNMPTGAGIGTPANRVEIDGVTLTINYAGAAATNDVYLEDTAGGLRMNNASLSSSTNTTFDLLVTNGDLTSLVDGTRDIGADIIILAVTGAGSTIGLSAAAPFEINTVVQLDASTSGGVNDHIWIDEKDNGLGIGLVNAGLGNVEIISTDASAGDARSIAEAGADAAADIVGNVVTLTIAVHTTSTIGTTAARLEINAVTLNATTPGGGIALEDVAGGVAIGAVTAATGAVNLLVTGGAITDDANDAVTDITGSTITLTATGGVGESAGNGSLDTAATSLDVSVTAAGLINLSEADAVTLTDIDTANGSITIVAGGTITATDVASLSDNDANDVSLTATVGDITLTTVNAGTTAGDVNLTAAGVITGGTVTADAVTASAATGITLNTTAVTLSATTSGAGNIVLTESNGANVLNVAAANGDATVTTSTGPLNVTAVSASGNVTLTATTGAITDANAAAVNVTATLLTATGATGIDLDTAIAQLTAATTNTAIAIRETNGVAVNTVNAGTGNVTLTLAAGAITDNNGVGTLNVTAGLLDATGPGGVDLDTSVTSLTAASTNAALVIREADAVAVNTLTAGTDMISLGVGGAITDGNGGGVNNVTAGSLLMTAVGGISLDTTVGQLAASNATSGDITITNTGALNITTLSEPSIGSVSGVQNPAGAVTVIALSPLTVSSPVSALGAVVLTASDSAAAGDDLTINATVTSTGSSITLNSGDNTLVTANLSAATTLAINIDSGDLDPNPVTGGATLNIGGAVVITATGATFTGGGQGDSFTFAPQVSTAINVLGLNPTANPNGDTLTIDTALATNPTLAILAGQGAGIYTFGNRASVQYSSIETATATTPIHISLDAGATGIENILLQRSAVPAGTNFEVYEDDVVDTILYAGPIANVLSFLFLGSGNSNTVTIDDVNGLVDLAGTVPAPTGVGNNGNVAGTPEIFLRGNGGTDGIVYANTASGTDQTYGLGTGAGPGSQAGEVLTTNGVNSLSVYFDGMEDVTSNDATPGDVGTLTIVGDANANVMALATSGGGTTMAVTGGYVPFTFAPQSFNAFTVNAGDGNDSIAINSLNPGEAGLAISLNGENNDDTISVGAAPAGSTLLMQGGVGNDAYQLGGAGNLVDNIFIPVTIADPSGTDSLTVNDSSDLTGDTVTITATTIDGINSAPSPNVTFSGVESLDVTTSGGDDVINTTLTGPNNLATVNVRGAGGDDDFFLTVADGLASPTTLNLIGEAGSDDFGSAMNPMRPVIGPATNVFVYGDTTAITTNPGGAVTDRLYLDMATSGGGTTVQPLVIVDTVGGIATATNTRTFRFGGIDDIDLYNGTELTDVQIGDVYLLGSSASERFVLYRDQAGMMLKYNGMASPLGPFAPAVPNGRMVIYGAAGNDYMEFNFTLGSTVGASFNGGADNDTLIGGLGNDTLAGGAGSDTIRGGEGADRLFGEDAPSTASAVPIATQRATGLVFSASGGNDSVDGGGGNDFVFGGIGDDNLIGGPGDDYIHGGDGNDTLNSMGGNDILRGEAGADLLNGDSGADILLGGAGDDRLFGRGGRDFMLAGLDADQVQDSEGSEDVTVTGGLAFDADAGFTQPGSSWTGLNDNDLALQALMFAGPNAWNAPAPFAARVGNLTPLTAMTNDTVADLVLGNTAGQDYIISNANDMRLNTAGDLLLTL